MHTIPSDEVDRLVAANRKSGAKWQWLFSKIGDMEDGVRRLHALFTIRPSSEYDEGIGPVLWWRIPGEDPPCVGLRADGYTHWSPLPDRKMLTDGEWDSKSALDCMTVLKYIKTYRNDPE